MPWEGWLTLGTIGLMAFALVRGMAGPDTVLLAGLALLMSVGVFSDRMPEPAEIVAGFGNEGLIAIGVLFVVAQGLFQTGAMSMVTRPLLGRPRSVASAQMRLMPPVAVLSGFMNNTPIVAMFMPVVHDWTKKTGLAASKLFMPLSYAAILGGVCTLIGTSTNLVVHGLVLDAQDANHLAGVELHMFTIAAVGVPVALAGMAYVLIASPRLLPDRKAPDASMDDARRYSVEMLIEKGSAVAGKSIEDAGLRHLPGVYLASIEREGELLPAPGPETVLHSGDRLIFVGRVDSIADLQKVRGLVPAADQVFKLDQPRPNRVLVEAVVSNANPLVGKSIREGRFRTVYDAVVIAVHRGGRHLHQRIGDIVLRPGDTLLIESHPAFVDRQRHRRDFYLVSKVDGSRPPRHEKAWMALAILIGMVALITLTPMSLLNGALLAAGAMVLTGCCQSHEARGAVDLRVLLAIGAAIGIGRALESSGAAGAVAGGIIELTEPLGPVGLLAGVYLVTLLFNMMIGHVGAAVLVFPIALAAAARMDLNAMPFIISIMVAASADFASPTSYPTHIMVYGAGGYRFSDYVRFGLPLNAITMAVTVGLAPVIWPVR